MSAERFAVVGQYNVRFKAKPPGATLDYLLDFADMSLDLFPVTLLAVSWSVVALAGDAAPLSIVSQSLLLGVASVRLAGGSPLSEYSVRGQCSWSDGETSVVYFALPISYLPNAATLFPLGVPGAELFGLPSVH